MINIQFIVFKTLYFKRKQTIILIHKYKNINNNHIYVKLKFINFCKFNGKFKSKSKIGCYIVLKVS